MMMDKCLHLCICMYLVGDEWPITMQGMQKENKKQPQEFTPKFFYLKIFEAIQYYPRKRAPYEQIYS